jgi:alkane 1-monooxygenase
LSDYVQHYGLRRAAGERVATAHSWNAPQWFSSSLMLNAPRHSDHHAHPTRPYPALRLEDDAPILPWPLPLACFVALIPRLWRRKMARALTKL